MAMRLADRIDNLYLLLSGTSNHIDIKIVFKAFWPVLRNGISLVDLAGIFSIAIPSVSVTETLNQDLFPDFFRAFSRLCYPSGTDYVEKMLNDLKNLPLNNNKSMPNSFSWLLCIADKAIVRLLLKYDIQLRKIFCTFCSQSIRVGGIISWEDVKTMNLGMELDGFIAFASAHSLLPQNISTARCEEIFNELLNLYPINENQKSPSNKSLIYFPQFQLSLLIMASEKDRQQSLSQDKTFTDKKVINNLYYLNSLQTFFKELGLDKNNSNNVMTGSNFIGGMNSTVGDASLTTQADSSFEQPKISLGYGNLILSSNTIPMNLYDAGGSSKKQGMMMRLDHLFNIIEEKFIEKLREEININTEKLNEFNGQVEKQQQIEEELKKSQTVLEYLFPENNRFGGSLSASGTLNPASSSSMKATSTFNNPSASQQSKPLLICDAIPIPSSCPPTILQLLEASLAHHNLGSYEEALKFLEAAKIQLNEIFFTSYSITIEELIHNITVNNSAEAKNGEKKELILSNSIEKDFLVKNYYNILMYILLCKGNVYQSCGDDEKSLLQYLDGLNLSKIFKNDDWEILCIHYIGILSYYNLRYEISLMSFHFVYEYRASVYSIDCVDTTIVVNNYGSVLYCMNFKKDSRLYFEKSWKVLTNLLGYRDTRCISIWKNLEKSRKIGGLNNSFSASGGNDQRSFNNKKNYYDESIQLREDADKLILGGEFVINAIGPVENKKKKKKKLLGKKKKK